MTYLDDVALRIRCEVSVDLLPDEDTTDLFRSYAILALALGTRVQSSDVHNAWVAWMLERHPDHPALVPFDELPGDVQQRDVPFAEAIRRVAIDLGVT